MIKQLLSGAALTALISTGASAQLLCTDTLEIYGQGASCGTSSGYACAYLWNGQVNSYQWNNGSTASCIQNAAPGTYTVTVTDQSGCTYTGTYTVTNDPLWVYDCSMLCDTTPANNYLEACPSGGTAPFTYLWNNGSNTQPVISAPANGTYSVTVTDANGCVGTMTTTVTTPTPINVTANVTAATCGSNGSIDLTISGGTGFMYIDWYDNMQNWVGNSEDLTGVQAGTYSVYIYDSSQCSGGYYNTFTVGGANAPQVQFQVIGERCLQSDGVIFASAVNFSGTPTFVWSNGMTGSTVSGLSHGIYAVTVSDGNCSTVETVTVWEDSCNIIVAGTLYNASGSGNCNPSGAWGMAYKPLILQPLGIITFTDMYGYYSFQVPSTGNYTVELYNVPTGGSLLCPSTNSIAVNASAPNYYGNNDFYVVMPNSQDMSINWYNYTTATPGFPLWTVVYYCNNGSTPQAGSFTYTYDPVLTYDTYSAWWSTATFNNHDAVNRVLTFDYNLNPGACESIEIDFNTAVSAVLGSTVSNCVHIDPTAGDADLTNNDDCDDMIVVGSWDPNSKHVSPYHTGDELSGGVILPTENQLEYTINFQNMGTAPAVNVIIRDTLDANIEVNTIEGVQASHPCTIRIEDGNILIFEFANIYLPDTAADYEGSNGYVHFFINRTAGLPLGTQIPNTAAIYFDFNAPVITNTVVSTIDELNSTSIVMNQEMNVQVMPNPFQQNINVQYELKDGSDVSIELYNALGERVATFMPATAQSAGAYQFQFTTNNLASGVYFLNITTNKGAAIQRIIKS